MKIGFKTIVTVAAAAMIYCSPAAHAAQYDINIYGASAQYNYWNDTADDFLSTSKGCTTTTQATHSSKKHGITKGTGCTGGHTYYVRYTSKASYDGIYACERSTSVPGGQPTCESTGPGYREMADESNTNWSTGVVNSLACKEVNIGASDVAGSTFGQASPARAVGAITTTKSDKRPFAITFGFFKNKDALPSLTNLTRLQAGMIFSGTALSWDQFGPTYPSKDIIACLREAGSGTHATLAAAVMRGDWPLATASDEPYISFNDGSSDMMACINGNNGESTSTAGAVGYADADSREKCSDCQFGTGCDGDNEDATYPATASLLYNGAEGNADNVAGCVYSFWSAQWLYVCDANYATLAEDLYQYAKTNGDYYNASKKDLEDNRCKKDTDKSMPTFY